MNTAKIAALYPYFLDSLRYASAGQRMEDLLIKRLQTETLPAIRRYSIALTDLDNPDQHADWLAEVAGVTIQEFSTERLFNWVRQQVPNWADGYLCRPTTGWRVYLQASQRLKPAGEETLHLYANSDASELATVLRGLRAHQAKRRKRARRLLAQLSAYYLQQEQARVAATAQLAAIANPTPTVSCFDLPSEEYFRRVDAAEDLEEQMQQKYNNEGRYGREIMWHPSFADHCVTVVRELPLVEITTWLAQVPQWANQGRALDRHDYGYLTDLLREALADNPAPAAALRLHRTLAVVEQAATTALQQPQAAQLVQQVIVGESAAPQAFALAA